MKTNTIISLVVLILSSLPITYYYMVQKGHNYALSSILPGSYNLFGSDLSRKGMTDDYKQHHFKGDKTADTNHNLAAESYFAIATEFFEWGWGDAIHMAPMKKEWSFKQSMNYWELWFAKQINITSESIVVDLGMGVGGPLRRIAEFTGAHITGVTNSAHQINRAQTITKTSSPYIQKRVAYIQSDYNSVDESLIPSNSVDVVYFMESLSHSDNRTGPISQAYRILKPGGIVGAWQWMLKDGFNYNDSYHLELKHGMEYGGGLSNLNKPNERIKEFNDAGFDNIIYSYDMSDVSNEMDWFPFWKSLNEGHDIPSMFTSSYFGRYLTMFIAWFTELIGIADVGTYEVAVMLEFCADCTVKSGKLDIFTPLWLTVAKKPMDA